jgi:hypothetical protein
MNISYTCTSKIQNNGFLKKCPKVKIERKKNVADLELLSLKPFHMYWNVNALVLLLLFFFFQKKIPSGGGI